MQTVILCTGLPGSGKSTWAREHARQFDGAVVLTSRDDIRAMLGFGPIGTRDQEDLVSRIQDDVITRAVNNGKSVIVHDTNLSTKAPNRIKKLFDGDVKFAVADFTNVPVEVCIERDAQRPNPVGKDVIKNMARQLQKPWRLTPEFMNDVELPTEYFPPVGKELALIVDIDGTLAEHVARSPYDYSRVGTDAPISSIVKLVNTYYRKGYIILVTSGRPDVDNVRKDTVAWLDTHGIFWDHLFMRPADKLKENDADVKQLLFDEHIRHNYVVEFVLDDRDRVVKRWRKLGLKVLQVAPGDF